MSKDVSGGSDDMVAILQEQIQSQQQKITELADEVDRNRRNLKEKETVLLSREKVILLDVLYHKEFLKHP